MSRPLDNRTIEKICCSALKLGMPEAARRNGLSVPRVSQIFSKYKLRVFMLHELYADDGKERSFKELRTIFNSSI
jgi:hypothetical protein